MNNGNSENGTRYSADDVRQGKIILKKPWQRALFIIGLSLGVSWAVLLAIFFNSSP